MSELYNATPGSFGGFTSPVPGGSSSKGFYQQPMNLPFYQGRSLLASIPEYQRNPLLLEKDLMYKISEGRNNLMKILFDSLEMNGGVEVSDVRFRLPIEIDPVQRIYLAVQSTVGTGTTITVKLKSNNTPVATAKTGGRPNQVGDIARLEVGQFVMSMFSWTAPGRTTDVSYSPNALSAKPVPEIWKIMSIDYKKATITVERNWAGEQRTSEPSAYTAFTVASTGSWSATPPAVAEKYAFIIPMAKSMKEDEIDAKIRNYSGTWAYGLLQRHLLAWGGQMFSETISKNMGIESPMVKSKRQALKDFIDHWEWTALFGEKSESFDPETSYWSGTTDGLLANIPKSHWLGIKGINYAAGFTAGSSTNLGSFHPLIFNKLMEAKGYMGSQTKNLVCGSAFYTAFTTMINFMTQNVPDIKSSWQVTGKSFTTSDGLTINVSPSDKMTLNGMSHSAILFDPQAFKSIKLRNYPSTDIVDDLKNENPLKQNGFIHGVKGWIDLNPDSHWVFTVVENTLADGTANSTAYDAAEVLGSEIS